VYLCCLSDKIKLNGSNHFSVFAQNLIYIPFSIFYYCQKICKDVEKENDGINGMVTRKFHLIAAKKEIFKQLFVYLMSENTD
jgi:hypothetical protein